MSQRCCPARELGADGLKSQQSAGPFCSGLWGGHRHWGVRGTGTRPWCPGESPLTRTQAQDGAAASGAPSACFIQPGLASRGARTPDTTPGSPLGPGIIHCDCAHPTFGSGRALGPSGPTPPPWGQQGRVTRPDPFPGLFLKECMTPGDIPKHHPTGWRSCRVCVLPSPEPPFLRAFPRQLRCCARLSQQGGRFGGSHGAGPWAGLPGSQDKPKGSESLPAHCPSPSSQVLGSSGTLPTCGQAPQSCSSAGLRACYGGTAPVTGHCHASPPSSRLPASNPH